MGATRTLEPDVIDPHIKNIATNKQVISMTTTEILYIQWSRNITSFFSSKTGGFVLINRGITEAANDMMTTGRTGIRARIKSVNSIAIPISPFYNTRGPTHKKFTSLLRLINKVLKQLLVFWICIFCPITILNPKCQLWNQQTSTC